MRPHTRVRESRRGRRRQTRAVGVEQRRRLGAPKRIREGGPGSPAPMREGGRGAPYLNGDGRLPRRSRQAKAAEPESSGRSRDVQRNADPGRSAQADGRNQPESSAYRADGGTCCIGSVKSAGHCGGRSSRCRERALRRREPRHCNWEGRSHCCSRNPYQEKADRNTQHREERRGGSVRVRPRKSWYEGAQRTGENDRDRTDEQLDRRIQHEKSPAGIGAYVSADPRTCGHPSHECGQHRARRRGGVAELQQKHPRPRDLIHERGGARGDVTGDEDSSIAIHQAAHRSPQLLESGTRFHTRRGD